MVFLFFDFIFGPATNFTPGEFPIDPGNTVWIVEPFAWINDP